jgi:hypothetical protein
LYDSLGQVLAFEKHQVAVEGATREIKAMTGKNFMVSWGQK